MRAEERKSLEWRTDMGRKWGSGEEGKGGWRSRGGGKSECCCGKPDSSDRYRICLHLYFLEFFWCFSAEFAAFSLSTHFLSFSRQIFIYLCWVMNFYYWKVFFCWLENWFFFFWIELLPWAKVNRDVKIRKTIIFFFS